jgi:aryl-alcohol dehydrogenase-like predicted oxidoreductase
VERRRLGRTDMHVSVLGFGGSEIGYQRIAAPTVARLLEEAVDAGVNVVDTAECYERSEALIGRAIAGRRDAVYLFTKCGHAAGWGREDWRPAALLRSIERSVRRLRVDHVDLIQLHSCDEDELRRGDVIGALETARERGLTRYIGYSGDGPAALHAIECGRFDTLQTSVSIADQEALDLTLPRARERGLGVIAKRPIANAVWRTGRAPRSAYERPYWDRLQRLGYDLLRAPLPESIALALRFTVGTPGVHTAIVGTTRPGRVRENAASLGAGPLDAATLNAIRQRWREVADATWIGQM